MKAFASRAILSVILAACFSEFASAQLPRSLPIMVSYKADLGANGYGLEFFDFGEYFSSGVSVTAPDGTVFQDGPGAPFIGVGSLTLSDLTTRFAGDWTINDNWELPVGAPTQQHRFSVSAAALSTFPLTTPQILSPPSGSLLPYSFGASFTNDRLYLFGDDFRYSTPLPVVDVSGIPAVYPKVVEARAAAFGIASNITVTPLNTSPKHRFSTRVVQTTYSAPVTWTVGVPEPSTVALGGLALLSLAALRRRK